MMVLLKLRNGQYSLVEEKIHAKSFEVGKTVSAINLSTECVLAAIMRHGQLIIPHGAYYSQQTKCWPLPMHRGWRRWPQFLGHILTPLDWHGTANH
jgi:hypothetical protein